MNFSNEIRHFDFLPVTIISSFGHNGLDWIHSLLDSHPNISLMPAYSFFRTLDFYEERYGHRIENIKNSIEVSEKLTNFLYLDPSYQVITRKFIFNDEQLIQFKKNYLIFFNNTSHQNKMKKLFFGINFSFCKLYNLNIKNLKMIISQEHVSWHSRKYKNIFDSKFIFMMRDPRAGLAGAWKRQSENQGLSRLNPFDFDKSILAGTYLESFYKRLSKKERSKIKIMINEKMHVDLKKEMESLCNWLGINFFESCLDESFLGKEWLGESSYLGVDELEKRPPKNFYEPKNIEARWRARLSDDEIVMIETIFNYSFKKFGYLRDSQSNLKNITKGFFNYFSTSLTNQNEKKFFITQLKVIRNLIRRLLIKFLPSFVPVFFKIP